MEENAKSIKVTYTKNMNKFNFNTTVSMPIDTNANIKTILDINSYMYDHKVECGNGKAIISGKIGLKVLYVDTDNMTNSITDSTNFSETLVDNSITSDTYLNILNSNIISNVLSADSTLKVNCDVTIAPVAYLNLGLNNSIETNEMLITQKREVQTNTISSFVNTQFEHTTNMETKDNITKILCNNSYFSAEKISADDGFAVVEGKIMTSLVYETQNGEDTVIKEMKETFNLKCDVEANGLNKDDLLDLSFMLDKSNENTSTEVEDNMSVVMTKHTIKVCGVVLKKISIDIVDDMFSTENEIETTKANRECTKNAETFSISEVVSNEITLQKEETAIDELIANLSITPEITNTYIKDNTIYLEGVISSNLAYIDENKEYKYKAVEIPFIINTKIPAETLGCVHSNISVVDNRVKVKRGTIIEFEYSLFISLTIFEKENHQMVDSFTIGKPLNFGDYDYQIFIAKPNETMWELCKRIKISPNDITKYNKDLPLVCNGGEKVIIKR
ncbi:MAG: DUF3794 domain-containing protein [Clostridia bacterium]|nr:DUF3794 domain-containing protein [Clostridia bacterium]